MQIKETKIRGTPWGANFAKALPCAGKLEPAQVLKGLHRGSPIQVYRLH